MRETSLTNTVQEGIVKLSDSKIEYLSQGQGQPIVFLPSTVDCRFTWMRHQKTWPMQGIGLFEVISEVRERVLVRGKASLCTHQRMMSLT